MQQAVFLDRDGTINVEKGYLIKPEDWSWIPGAVEAVKRLNELGFLVIVVTNQSGIARGLYGTGEVLALHRFVDALLAESGAKIDAYYFCPHHPDYGEIRNCGCRKPKPGMLLKAREDFDIDFDRSYMIGDKCSDIAAGQAAGVTPIWVATGHGCRELCKLTARDMLTAKDLWEACQMIETQRK